MEIYLPIVQVHIDIITILFISFAVGVLSGLFGVGGGFLMTPFLIFLGIPPVYAVPNEINNILGSKVNGFEIVNFQKFNLSFSFAKKLFSKRIDFVGFL